MTKNLSAGKDQWASARAQACAKASGLASYSRHPCMPGEVRGGSRRIYSSLSFTFPRSPPAWLPYTPTEPTCRVAYYLSRLTAPRLVLIVVGHDLARELLHLLGLVRRQVANIERDQPRHGSRYSPPTMLLD